MNIKKRARARAESLSNVSQTQMYATQITVNLAQSGTASDQELKMARKSEEKKKKEKRKKEIARKADLNSCEI